MKLLGEGSCGRVYQVMVINKRQQLREFWAQYAIKSFEHWKFAQDPPITSCSLDGTSNNNRVVFQHNDMADNSKQQQQQPSQDDLNSGLINCTRRELAGYCLFQHPCLTPMLALLNAPGATLLLTTLAFSDLLKFTNQAWNRSTLTFICTEILLSFLYLHSNGYIHGDIKPDNVLVMKSGHVKLSDLGCVGTFHTVLPPKMTKNLPRPKCQKWTKMSKMPQNQPFT
jgi:serine/threonine protein kinase